MILEGSQAPSFNLPNQNDEKISSEALSGKPFIIFFYPRDNTSGCTKENIDFNTMKSSFDDLGITLIGVSRDSIKSHDKFATKFELNFSLLADTEEVMCKDYNVLVEKSMYGKKYMGIERSTFLVSKNGEVLKCWHKVKVPGHVEDVLKSAQNLLG